MEWYWVGWFLGFAFGVGVSAAVWGLYLGSTWALLGLYLGSIKKKYAKEKISWLRKKGGIWSCWSLFLKF